MNEDQPAQAEVDGWIFDAAEVACNAIELSAPTSQLEWRFSAAEENYWGMDLIEIAPAVEEIREQGPNDGEQVYGIPINIDILRIQEDVFQEVHDVTWSDGVGNSSDSGKWFTFDGTADGRRFILRIKSKPFDSTPPSASPAPTEG